MDITEVFDFVDQLVVEKTGKHLDDVQKILIEGIWQRQNYEEIAKECYRSRGHVADTASKLFQLLSKELEEEVRKANFRSTLERVNRNSSQNSNISGNIYNNNSFVLQSVNQPSEKDKKPINPKPKSFRHDLSIAPKIIKFYDRESELQDLADWTLNQNTPLIAVLGLPGIGKSYLVKRFIDLNLDKFEVIIWKSLQYLNPFDSLINDIFDTCDQSFNPNGNNKIEQALVLLRKRKCLIIFDHLENLFIKQKFAGECQAQYQDYQQFFQETIKTDHQSHLILISQEKCQEMACLNEEIFPIKCLELWGLNHTEIFKSIGLKNEDCWLRLQDLYEGNPFYLQSISNAIQNVFNGSVREFLSEGELIITKDMEYKLQLLFNKLSPREKEIVGQLIHGDQPLSRQELKACLKISSTDLINGLESLQNRCLLTKINADKTKFKLSPVFREYVQTLSVPIG